MRPVGLSDFTPRLHHAAPPGGARQFATGVRVPELDSHD